MFAFALFNQRTGDLVLARDPFGIKPLYYLPRGGGAVFASELKALVAAIGSELRIEPGALVASMLYYWLPEQRCAIDGVRKLPGGSWALLRPDGTLTVQRYWRIADVAAEAAAGPARGPGRGDRGIRHRAPGGRRARVELPVRWPGFEHRHGAGPPGRTGDRRLHDHLPARGPAPRGDARRRRLRAEGRGAVRHQAARDRDLSRTSSASCLAWWTYSTSRSAILPRSTRCSCARRPASAGSRSSSPAWVPTSCSAATASTWPASWPAGTAGCPAALRAGVRFAVDRSRSAWAGAACGTPAGPSGS